jgi:hypothetical protein
MAYSIDIGTTFGKGQAQLNGRTKHYLQTNRKTVDNIVQHYIQIVAEPSKYSQCPFSSRFFE